MDLLKPSSTNSFFTAKDISEPLASVATDENERLTNFFTDDNFDVVGFNENGRVTGYLDKKDIGNLEELNKSVKKFEIHDLITSNTDLKDCLSLLETRQQLFIIDKSHVSGIVTRSDRQKPAVRMLFFGMITVFESKLAALIDLRYPQNTWANLINGPRVFKAQKLFDELVEKNLEVSLLNCTQICDKTDIVLKDAELRNSLIGLSKTKGETFFNSIQNLRNDLAHAQSLQTWFEKEDVMGLIDRLSHTINKIEKQLI